ncbi:MAG TPA: hypothetical protein VGC36_14380 [Rhizomicrobium sp.]
MRGGRHVAWALAMAATTLPACAAELPKCDVGPVTRNYGGAPWLVYSCHDLYRLLFVAPPLNPASPRTIVLSRDGAGFHVDSIGIGDRRAATDAGGAIRGLTADDFNALIGQTLAP